MAANWRHCAGTVLGRPIVYCSDHPATAMLEILVNVDAQDLPDQFQLLEISVPAHVMVEEPKLPAGWQKDKDITRQIFEDFCEGERAPLARVPSVVMPHAYNMLLNPMHPAASDTKIESATKHPLDPRLLS